jgi:hypothetical protein
MPIDKMKTIRGVLEAFESASESDLKRWRTHNKASFYRYKKLWTFVTETLKGDVELSDNDTSFGKLPLSSIADKLLVSDKGGKVRKIQTT